MSKSNILLITFDQLRADAVTGTLADCIPTPNLDRFRHQSILFENHFTVAVPCGPARASLLTGLYAMNHRSIRNGTPLASHHATIATEARKVGYEPLLFGYADTTPDPTHIAPLDPDLQTYEGVAPGFREIVELRFDDASPAWRADLISKGYAVPTPSSDKDLAMFRPVAKDGGTPALTDPAFYSSDDSDTGFLTTKALEALTVRQDRAWFAHLTYVRPHPPFVAPAPYNRLIRAKDVPARDLGSCDHPFIDAWFSEPSQSGLFWGFDGRCRDLGDDQIGDIRAIYCGLIAELDHHIGRIFDWLDESGQAERTIVIVTSDHGEMLGDKGMWGKDTVFDQAYRIPLMIRDPSHAARAGSRVSAITESVDVAPTLMEMIGLEPLPAMDGKSLCDWLAGESPSWRDASFHEVDFARPNRPTRFQTAWDLPENSCNAAILRETKWKYVHFNGGVAPMLFDLEQDPTESNNLADNHKHSDQLTRLARKMIDRRMEREDRRLTGLSFGV